jgi:hypothetical protein
MCTITCVKILALSPGPRSRSARIMPKCCAVKPHCPEYKSIDHKHHLPYGAGHAVFMYVCALCINSPSSRGDGNATPKSNLSLMLVDRGPGCGCPALMACGRAPRSSTTTRAANSSSKLNRGRFVFLQFFYFIIFKIDGNLIFF